MLAPRIRAGGKQRGMGWENLGEKPVVQTPWFRLNLAEVELSGGRRVDHHVLLCPPVVLAAPRRRRSECCSGGTGSSTAATAGAG